MRNHSKLHLKWIARLAFFGFVMGILSVNGFTKSAESILWLAFGVISAIVLTRKVGYRLFLHGFFVGLSWGFVNAIVQFLFFETYLANNPSVAESFEGPTLLEPRYLMLIAGPVIGLLTGIVLGGMTFLAGKVLLKNEENND